MDHFEAKPPRIRRVELRLTTEEYRTIRAASRVAGKTLAKWVRATLLERAAINVANAPILRRAEELRVAKGYEDPDCRWSETRAAATINRILADLAAHQGGQARPASPTSAPPQL